MTEGVRLCRWVTADGKEGWAKEVGRYVMPASSDEVAMWKELERLRGLLRRYGWHEDDCPAAADEAEPVRSTSCSCGWDDVEADLEAPG